MSVEVSPGTSQDAGGAASTATPAPTEQRSGGGQGTAGSEVPTPEAPRDELRPDPTVQTEPGYRAAGWNDAGWPTSRVPPVRGHRVQRLERRRRRRRLGAVAVVVVLAASALIFFLPHGSHPGGPPPPSAFGKAPPSVAWALSWGNQDQGASLAVVGVPPGSPAIAVVAADDAHVDLPSGAALTVAPASATGSGAIETSQALLNRRVGHYMLSTPAQIASLVDRMGGITFGAQGSVIVNGVPIGPGETRATGPQVEAYLLQGSGVDPWVRWEDVVSGIFDSDAEPSAWDKPPGTSDQPGLVTGLLRDAHGATVVDLPTATEFGLLKVDTAGMEALLASSFGSSVTGLVRVIVQNGNGLPGMGQKIGLLVAPYGYRVVDSQNAGSFDMKETQIVAANGTFMRWAREAQQLLGTGKVYLDARPTGIADLTIVVGKDYGTE
jgi:hypothetical protein